MARKVFISVLGSTNYGLCSYANENKSYQSPEVRFIQEATINMLNTKEWSDEDIGFVCLTEGEKGSRKLNWEDGGHRDRVFNKELEGLNSRIKKLQLPFEIKGITIKEGKNNNEIWEIFNDVYSLIKDDDEIYFDITHGFRYLPMLILVLSNYAKFLKNIKVKSITYGNYETRVNQDGVDVAPIIDLTDFSLLQDWTAATSDFMLNGKTDNIIELILSSDSTLSLESKEIKSLKSVQTNFETCRSKTIFKGNEIISFRNLIKTFKKKVNLKPLHNILDVLNIKTSSFKNDSLNNVAIAIEWCYNFGMYQQAITMGQEFILSVVLDLIFGEDKTKSKKNTRMAMNSFLSIDEETFNNSDSWGSNLEDMKDKFIVLKENSIIKALRNTKCLSEIEPSKTTTNYSALASLRNQINHGGVTDDTIPDSFIAGFKRLMDVNIKHLNEFGANYSINLK